MVEGNRVSAATDSGAAPEMLGVRLRAAREARRKTLSDVAEATGLTKGFLSRIERNRAAASVASLLRICEALEMSVGELFDNDVDARPVRKGSYPPIYLGGEGLTEYLLTPSFEQRLQVIYSVIEPGGGSGSEPYVLPSSVEFAFLLSGALEITFDDETVALRPGDALTFSARAMHSFRNTSETTPARVLWVLAPAMPGGARGHPDAGNAPEQPPPNHGRSRTTDAVLHEGRQL